MQTTNSKSELPRFKSQLCYLSAVLPSESHSGLCFLIYVMGIILWDLGISNEVTDLSPTYRNHPVNVSWYYLLTLLIDVQQLTLIQGMGYKKVGEERINVLKFDYLFLNNSSVVCAILLNWQSSYTLLLLCITM